MNLQEYIIKYIIERFNFQNDITINRLDQSLYENLNGEATEYDPILNQELQLKLDVSKLFRIKTTGDVKYELYSFDFEKTLIQFENSQ